MLTLNGLTLSLWLLFVGGSPAPAAAPAPAGETRIVESTTRTDASGNTSVTTRSAEASATTVRVLTNDGEIESTLFEETRVLIELKARPLRARTNPGSAAEAARQRGQLVRDLEILDRRLKPRQPSRVRRHYQTLFSGVAATVSTASIKEIRRLPNVKAVHEDVEVRAQLAESVPLIGATAVANTYGVTGAGVKVAVIDTGIDYTHPDLGGCLGAGCKVAAGYDFVNDDADPKDDFGHGTHVAGIIAASGAVKGVAPGATLLAYKVLDSYGSGSTSDIIAAIERAVTDGADVANLSLGGPGYAGDPTSQAIDNATAAGMLSVVAAGNSGPFWNSIASPGVARTALTVGAADKSWVMAHFSSRGYVTDGEELVMKPEVVAPGVSIRSTVPTSGLLGDPSGYHAYDGTSLATPHVAGSAALLLDWNAAQTPEELKARLVASARSIGEGPFTQGAGAIDLMRAFALPILPASTHVSLGVIETTSGITERSRTLTIRNTTATTQDLSLTQEAPLPAGATLEIIPSSLILQQGQSASVTLRLRVDAAVTPQPSEPLAWSTRIAIRAGEETASIPVYFLKGVVIALSFDEPVLYANLHPSSGPGRVFYVPGDGVVAVVSRGIWDMSIVYSEPWAIVVREQQNVQNSLSLAISRTEATHALTLRAIDDAQQPLRAGYFINQLWFGRLDDSVPEETSYLLRILSQISNSFRVSPMSSRYFVGLCGSGPDPSGTRNFTSNWWRKGVSADVTLPLDGMPFRRLTQAAPLPAGASSESWYATMSGFAVRREGEGAATAIVSGVLERGEMNLSRYFQSNFEPTPGPILPIQSSMTEAYDRSGRVLRHVDSAALHHTGGTDIVVDQRPWFHLTGHSPEPDLVLGKDVTRWDVDTPLHSVPLRFTNDSLEMEAVGRAASGPGWVTHTLSKLGFPTVWEPYFNLYREGVLVRSYPFSILASGGVALPAAAHEIRATSGYTIGDVPGSSQLSIGFDMSKTDRNPPSVTAFRIEENGQRTVSPLQPSVLKATKVLFEVSDPYLNSVVLEWRQSGGTTWTPLPYSVSGRLYTAPLELEGRIDLRVIAIDASGNKFEEEWTPALVTVTSLVASNTGPYCEGATIHLSASTASGATYAWTGPNGFTSSEQNPTRVNATTADSGRYFVTVTVGSFSAATSTDVIVNTKPDAATIAVASPMFSGASATASVNVSSAGTTFAWSIYGGTITAGAGTPRITFTASAGPTLTLGITVTSANGCSDTKSAIVSVQTAAFGPPPSFQASAVGTTSAHLNWAIVQSASHFEIYRSTDAVNWAYRDSTHGITFSDNGLTPSTTYFYKVRSVKADTTVSAFSRIDPATTIAFTDDPIPVCSTVCPAIRTVYITQLRTAVNTARASLGLPAFTFTDSSLTSSLGSGLPIKTVHLTELRTALAPFLGAIGITPSYTDPTITPALTAAIAAHIRELRDLIR